MWRYNGGMKRSKIKSINTLTPEEYHTTQEKGTDTPFSGRFVHNDKTGTYHCVVCENLLFSSETKFDSGSGWPSFYDMAHEGAVDIVTDLTRGMSREEVVCKKCGAHLGHIFQDGPKETTGLRYCINSSGLTFSGETKKNDTT
jgi:peptide-methionine (R)-S-oxide reductase